MAALPLRTRDHPDIRARISINDESPNDIREQLQLADQTQNKLRSQQSWHPLDTPHSLHRTILRKTRTLPYPYRLGHLQDFPVSDALPNPLNRSTSFDSVSTLQRHTEAAALSLYRGSPISAISPPSAALACQPDVIYEPQDPCPPLHVETLSQQRKYQKLLKKSLKKKEKELVKAQKKDEQHRRAVLAAEVAAERRKAALARGDVAPRRSKSTKAIASEVVQKLNIGHRLSLKRPLNKLSRQIKGSKSSPPTLEDFDTKEQVREYLNPPRRSDDIAELPAELPQYTPFQDSTRTQDNEPLSVVEDTSRADPKTPQVTVKEELLAAKTAPRSMRCDSCSSPIRLSQIYYQCSICENGDRIICSACDQAGWSCRHDLFERVRSVSKAREPSQNTIPTPSNRERCRLEGHQRAAALLGAITPEAGAEGTPSTHLPQPNVSAATPWATGDLSEVKRSRQACYTESHVPMSFGDEARDMALRRREHDITFREKDVSLREREAAIREQRASLREQESALEAKQHNFTLQLHTALLQKMQEAATGVGAQFPDLSTTDYVRSHATKRKATGGQAAISPSNSTGSNNKASPKRSPSGGPNEDEDDELGSGTPKKIKQDPDAFASPEKLYACPHCKFDKSRYSELNVQEKHYRGCSSGYWPDISRLKQHLYRVHCRRLHCLRCWNKFETKEQLKLHMREPIGCPLAECPCPEKFDEAQFNDIRRKRPASSPEQVWYTIYGILFPGQPLPASPYADNAKVEPSPVASPGMLPSQDAMDLLGESFDSRLDQQADVPERAWLRLPGTREFLREQLRASMRDMFQVFGNAGSPSITHPSLDVSPYTAHPPGSSTRRSSISLTPNSSIPPSPVTGPGATTRTGADSHFLLPSHRQSFSRPFPSRVAQRHTSTNPVVHSPQQGLEQTSAASGVVFPAAVPLDVENDHYDVECNSWSHNDEQHGLAISTDFKFGFGERLPAPSEGMITSSTTTTTAPSNFFDFKPVKLASISDSPGGVADATAMQLKPNHSTTSSVDSGYGSLSRRTASSSSVQPHPPTLLEAKPVRRPARNKMKGKAVEQNIREPSPIDEAVINFDALQIPFQEFIGNSWEMDVDEFGNVGGESLSAFLYGNGLAGDVCQDDVGGNQVSGV